MTAGDLPKSSDPGEPGTKGVATVKGWIHAMKPPASATTHRKWVSNDGSVAQSDQQRWSQGGSSVSGAAGNGGSLWSPEIASAMGYGKKGRAGSAFQWWILVLSALLAIGSFIAWCVLVMAARDATQSALDALKVSFAWWDNLKTILLATAVAFPILIVVAVSVSLWRAALATKLNIHAPDERWRKSSKAFQVANVTSSVLLYILMLMLIASIGAHYVWAFSARTAHIGSYYAIKYVDPIWNGTTSVVQASQNLVNNFVGLTQALPGLGRRLQEAGDGGLEGQDYLVIGGRRLTASDLESMPPEVLEAGLAAARSLQQLPNLFNNLGGWLSGAASALNNVPMPQINTANLPNMPFLPQLLPNGTSNPLFNTLRGVTDAVQAQLLNSTGCPIFCVDLRNQSWIQDGCMCNLERVKAAYPYVAKIYSQAIPTIVMMFLMTIASTWLLLHAASQWARTRTEAKLLHRIPHAAKHALAVQHSQQYANGGDHSGGGVGGKVSSTGEADVAGGRLSSGGGGVNGVGKGRRGFSSSSGGGGEASAPILADGADVPAKQQPAPVASV